jgi:ubiquinone/menaquinone biosynthesis C-methylase UbiE
MIGITSEWISTMELAEFDQFADEYEQMHAANIAITGEKPDFFSEYKIRILSADIENLRTKVRSIIDFGAGTGNSVPYFRKYVPDSALTCTDVSQKSLDIAGQRFPGAMQSVLLQNEKIAAPDDSFGVAFSACVFHHIPHEEHGHWLRELRRVVRPDGMIAIFEHNPLNPLTVRAVKTCPFDANAHLIRAGQLRQSLRAAGWRDIAIRYHLFFPRALASLRVLEPSMTWLPLGAQYSAIARK